MREPISKTSRRAFLAAVAGVGAVASANAVHATVRRLFELRAASAAPVIVDAGAQGGGTDPYADAPYVVPGSVSSTNVNADASATWPYDNSTVSNGTVLQEGYGAPVAGCCWASERYQESVVVEGVANDVWIGIVGSGIPTLATYQAGDYFNGISVEVAIGAGAAVTLTTPMAHPQTGKVAYWCRVRASDLPSGAASGIYEVRAHLIAPVGQSVRLQGKDPTGSGLSADVLSNQASLSHYVALDKGDLPRQAIYKAPNDGTEDGADSHAGTAEDPCVTWKQARALQRAALAADSRTITTHYLTASQEHEWGVQSTTDDGCCESGCGWTTITVAPGLTAADVTISRYRMGAAILPASWPRLKQGNIPWRKARFYNFSLGEVAIFNTTANSTQNGYDANGLFDMRVEAVVSNRSQNLWPPVYTATLSVGSTVSSLQVDASTSGSTGASAGINTVIPSGDTMTYVTLQNTGSETAYYTTVSTTQGVLPAAPTTSSTSIAAGASVNLSSVSAISAICAAGQATTLTLTYNPTNAGMAMNDYFIQHGDYSGAVEFIDTNIEWVYNAGMYQVTYMRDCAVNYSANPGDVADNPKYIAGFSVSNSLEGVSWNHLDVIQPTASQQVLANRWLQDITATASTTSNSANGTSSTNYGGQMILADTGHSYHSSMFLRITADMQHGYSLATPEQNNRMVYPNLASGSVPPWNACSAAPTIAALYGQPANTYYWFDDAGQGLGYHERFYRRGIKKFYPFTTKFPNPGYAYPTSTLQSIASGYTWLSLLDLDVDDLVMRQTHSVTWPTTLGASQYSGGVVKLLAVNDCQQPELPTQSLLTVTPSGQGNQTTGSLVKLMSDQLSANDAVRPTIVEGTHRQAVYDGINTYSAGAVYNPSLFAATIPSGSTTLTVVEMWQGSIQPGQTIVSEVAGLPAGTTIVQQLTTASGATASSGAEGTYELSQATTAAIGTPGTATPPLVAVPMYASQPTSTEWTMIMQLDVEPNAGATGNLWHCGRTATNLMCLQSFTSGGVQRLLAQGGQTNGTTTSGAVAETPTSAPAVTGPGAVLIEGMSDRVRLTYYNADTVGAAANTADGLGYYVDALYTSGYGPSAALAANTVMAIGCHSASFGYQPGALRWNVFGIIAGLFDATTRANVIAELRARAGLS